MKSRRVQAMVQYTPGFPLPLSDSTGMDSVMSSTFEWNVPKKAVNVKESIAAAGEERLRDMGLKCIRKRPHVLTLLSQLSKNC